MLREDDVLSEPETADTVTNADKNTAGLGVFFIKKKQNN